MAEPPCDFNIYPRFPVKPNIRKFALPRTPPKVASPITPSTNSPVNCHPDKHRSDGEVENQKVMTQEEEIEDDEDEDANLINSKELLLEIQRMRIEIGKEKKRHAAIIMALQKQLFQYQNSHERV
ncbi:hypothetical protein Golomagni_05007 [Golovinomyces magnicellulatus]|nr:hypothetical protein Golomagni_05007 [Golovinomyces magnicellulatus]